MSSRIAAAADLAHKGSLADLAADYFAAKYDSRALGVLVAVVGIVALIPPGAPQFKVDHRGDRVVWRDTVRCRGGIGAAVVTAYVMVSGGARPGPRW